MSENIVQDKGGLWSFRSIALQPGCDDDNDHKISLNKLPHP